MLDTDTPPRLILASSAPHRKLLLEALGIPFEIVPASIDEKSIRDKDLKIQAEKVARAKAENVASDHAGVVIAADAFVALDDKALEKPRSIDEARRMLKAQSGRTFSQYTGFCYLDGAHGINFSATAETTVTFRKLGNEEIEAYIASAPVMNYSAAFWPGHLRAAAFLQKVSGSYTGFTYGLPMELLIPNLLKSGFKLKS